MGCNASKSNVKQNKKKQNNSKAQHMDKKPANQKKGNQGPASEAVDNQAPIKKEAMDLDTLSTLIEKHLNNNQQTHFKLKKKLDLRMNNIDDMKFIDEFLTNKEYSEYALPDINELWLEGIKPDNKQKIKKFMNNHFPNSVKKFIMGVSPQVDHIRLNSFIGEIENIGSHVSNSVAFHKFFISKESFEKTINSFSQTKEIEFDECNITSVGSQFDNKANFKTQHLKFSNTGTSKLSGWADNEEEFSSIVSAIANSSLKDSLTKFTSIFNQFDLHLINKYFAKENMSDVNIIHDDEESSDYSYEGNSLSNSEESDEEQAASEESSEESSEKGD
ncbi:unnamed protein product [Moneuplotes crassus]|uniref:Uncharacterized protein n=1 Tax=Euplotes crassus TaxID=5936 RepID=A0AAD1UA53_EUPCR|nr:unnamed protein product [Moneuplotes crassus]